MKPCEATCPKCGSIGIHRQHRLPGAAWTIEGAWTASQKRPWPSEFLAFDDRVVKTIKECITHHCRMCGFDWETSTMAVLPADVVLEKPTWTGLEINKTLAEARGRAGNPTGKLAPPPGTEPVAIMSNDLTQLVAGLKAHIQLQEGALVVDLDQPGTSVSKEFSGPRLFISRAKDDRERSGWRVLVHPDDGDPKLCVFVRDDLNIQMWTDAQEETHWPGGI